MGASKPKSSAKPRAAAKEKVVEQIAKNADKR